MNNKNKWLALLIVFVLVLFGILFAFRMQYDRASDKAAANIDSSASNSALRSKKWSIDTAYHRIDVETFGLEFLKKGWDALFERTAGLLKIDRSEVLKRHSKWRPFFDLLDPQGGKILIGSVPGDLFAFDLKSRTFAAVQSNLRNLIMARSLLGTIPKWLETQPLLEKIKWLTELGARDIEIVRDTSRGDLVLVAANVWGAAGCMFQRVYMAPLAEYATSGALNFEPLFKSDRCVVRHPDNVGSRIAEFGDNQILLTVGLGDEGRERRRIPGQVLLIDLADGQGRVMTSGHRNPQGIFEMPNGKAVSSEHGARGGDEVNILVDGSDYGWPHVSYGIGYNLKPGSYATTHKEYTEPIFYFSPSPAVSGVAYYDKSAFSRWKGDLLVTSLKFKSLHRLDFDIADNRVRSREDIKLGCRLRDMEIDDLGQIYISCDNTDFLILRQSKKDYN